MYTGSVYQQDEPQQQQDKHQGLGLGQGTGLPPLQGQGQEQGQGQGQQGVSVRELLLIRRQAEYLQVQGCAEACDVALVGCFRRRSGGKGSPASPLAPVLELYSCRHLLPSEEEDNQRVKPVLAACRNFLVRNWDATIPDGEDQPSKAAILAWLLGGDAVRIANDEELLVTWFSLPASALEELLQSDHLSTDDEATVVALAEMWVAGQGSAATEDEIARVRAQLRLVNCSTSYLFDVLPKLPWLGPEPVQQAVFLARCRLSDRSSWENLGSQLDGYDTTTPWYGKRRPQSVRQEGVSYSWEVSREELLAGLRHRKAAQLAVTFQGASSYCADGLKVAALGCEWSVRLQVKRGAAHAGIFLFCSAPEFITAQTGDLYGGCCVSARVEVFTTSASVSHGLMDSVVQCGGGWGAHEALALGVAGAELAAGGRKGHVAEGADAAADDDDDVEASEEAALLAPWADYLRPDGGLAGTLIFCRPGMGSRA